MNFILLDTSVLIKMKGIPQTCEAVNSLLDRHTSSTIFVPHIVYYELLRQCSDKNDYSKSKKVLSQYKKFVLTVKIIEFATYYYNVLINFKQQNGQMCISKTQLSDIDIFMGASAMISNAMVCTTNRADFPSPFFDESDKQALPGTEKIYLLQADKPLLCQELEKIFTRLEPDCAKHPF